MRTLTVLAWLCWAILVAGCSQGSPGHDDGGHPDAVDAGEDGAGVDGAGGDGSDDGQPAGDGDPGPGDGDGQPMRCDHPLDALPDWFTGFVPRRELYLAPGGSDDNPGTSPDAPLATLAEAFSRLEPGTRLNLAAGTYGCAGLNDLHASADAPVVIRSADGPRQAVWDCQGGPGPYLVKVRYLALEGLEVGRASGHGVQLSSGSPFELNDLSSDVLLFDMFIHDTGLASFKASQARRVSVIQCELARAAMGRQMLEFVSVDDVVIAGCEGYQSDAFNEIKGGARGGLIFANHVHDTGGGIYVGGDCTGSAYLIHPEADFEARDVRVYNNRIVNVESEAFRIVSCHDCWVVNNTYSTPGASSAMRIIASAFDCGGPGEVPTVNAGLRIHNNIFAFDSPPNWMIPSNQPEVEIHMTHNVWWSSSGRDLEAIGSDVPFAGESHSAYATDPQFQSAPDDLRLSEESPLKGTGLPIDWLSGNAQAQCRSTPPDPGAY